MGHGLRLLQAGDVNLDVPLSGLAGQTREIQQRLSNARYDAFANLIDAAIEHSVDAVALSGNLCPVPTQGSRAAWFLHQQFSRLAKHDIGVLVRGDVLPPAPHGLSWPAHVVPTASRHAVSWMSRFRQTVRVSDGMHPLGLSGVADHQLILGGDVPSRQRLEHSPRTFWACSARSGCQLKSDMLERTHLCGPLQGSGFSECGPHGAWEFTIERGQVRDLQLVRCDAVHWYEEELLLERESTRSGLMKEMTSRMRQLQERAANTVIVRWILSGEGELLRSLIAPKCRMAFMQSMLEHIPQGCGLAGIETQAEPEQWESLISEDVLNAARQVRASFAKEERIDLQTFAQLAVSEIPDECRLLNWPQEQTTLTAQVDQRLWGELLVPARSA